MTKNKDATKNKKPIALYVMLIVFFLPLLTAIYARYNYTNMAHSYKNKGEFFKEEHNLSELKVTNLDGTTFEIDSLRGKWHFIYLINKKCDDTCKHNIYELGQVIKSLGKYSNKIDAIFIGTDILQQEELFSSYETSLKLLSKPNNKLYKRLLEHMHTTIIIDPNLNFILKYHEDGNPYDMLYDSKKLLKNSR